MHMLRGEQIAKADRTDWRKLAQGLHARFVVADQDGNKGVLCVDVSAAGES